MLIGDAIGAQFVPLDDLLAESDFVIVACALNDATKNLFNTSAFSKMKKTAIFINISRGGKFDKKFYSISKEI